MINYEILRVIWWVLLGVLLAGFAVMDGFDFGVAALLPFVAKDDTQRRIVINTVGPVWEGNQVWLILGAGAIFAAWPYIYAVSFSGFYLAMILALFTLIFRPVAFKYRSKLANKSWRSFWDWTLSICGILTALLLGVAVGNAIEGVPFHFNNELRMFYDGSFFGLLNPFAILCGVVSVAMLCMHGGLYLAAKTDSDIRRRAINCSRISAVITIILFALGGLWVVFKLKGYVLTGAVNLNGPSNPINIPVAREVGAWAINFQTYHWMLIAPILGFTGALVAIFAANTGNSKIAFLGSAASVFGIVTTVGVSMFPFILPSSNELGASLTVWDASSSQLTLQIMLIATLIFLPIILVYTTWMYRTLRGKLTGNEIADNDQAY